MNHRFNFTPGIVYGRTEKILFIFFLFILFLISSCITHVGEGDLSWNNLVSSHSMTSDMEIYKMHYIDIGKGKPVVLIHGFADSTYSWHENVQALLENGFRLIIVDQPGLGLSEIPPKPYVYSIENQSSEVLKLTEHLQLKSFYLIGHSMGGSIALYITLNHPNKVRKTIVIDPDCFYPPGWDRFFASPEMIKLGSIVEKRRIVKRTLKNAFYDPGKIDNIMIDEYAKPMNKSGYFKMLSSLRSDYYSPEFNRMTQRYGHITTPILIIWGANDDLVPSDYGKKLNELVHGSEFRILNNCGHNSHQECKDIVNPLLVESLKKKE
ncbi:MAG TPA: alpha/beta hydrolase [Nitrospirota bacterium]|nr:alpha/beta hydrolase [Nitrospirota bacterium]